MNEFDFALDVKAIGDDGSIEGVAAAYGNVDHGGDMIMPGALAKSLVGRARLPMLMFHDQKRPVGAWSDLQDTQGGLLVKGRFAMSTRAGQEAHALTKDGALGGISIGYKTLRSKMNGKVRELHEIGVHEASLVAIPMNERAQITSVKDIIGEGRLPSLPEFETFLREAGGFSKTQATAIAGKGLSHLLRGEPGDAPEDDFWSAMAAQLRA